jgi:hypothetical protein
LSALVRALLSLTPVAPARLIAVRTCSPDMDCPPSIAISLPVKSDTDLMSGRTIRRTTSGAALLARVAAVDGPADSRFATDTAAVT